jgi:glutathione S-transferase
LEKGIGFDTVPAVDGNGIKTDEFLATTPLGMTPVLVHGETCVFESALINEYINDEFPDPPLLPEDPAGRIEARKWIYFCEARLLSTLTAIAKAGDSRARKITIDKFNADMEWFGDNVLRPAWRGPYFFGDLFSLTDIAFFTMFQTVRQMEGMLGRKFAVFQPRIDVWHRNIAQRSSIRQAVQIQNGIPF